MFLQAYSTEYHTDQPTGMVYNNEQFKADVMGVMNYRRGIRDVTAQPAAIEELRLGCSIA